MSESRFKQYPAAGHPEATAPTKGTLFIISAPSGAGKTTLVGRLLTRCPALAYSVSFTTRPPRPGEEHGKDYHFISREAFEAGIRDNRWAEWAYVHGHYYGTCARWINDALTDGKNVLMDIDVQGTKQIRQRFKDAVAIFIMPPSLEELRRRLQGRGTDTRASVDLRLKNAEQEMAQKHWYDLVIVNDNLDEATEALVACVADNSRLTPTNQR